MIRRLPYIDYFTGGRVFWLWLVGGLLGLCGGVWCLVCDVMLVAVGNRSFCSLFAHVPELLEAMLVN